MKKMLYLLPVFALIVGCGGEDDNYFPLTAGNAWYYDYVETVIDPDTTFYTGTYALELGALTTLDNGTEVFPLVMTPIPDDTMAQTVIDTLYLEETDDYIMAYYSKADTIPSDTMLAFPLELGKTWTNHEITDQVDVTVPYGNFSNCWEITRIIDDDTTYSYWKSGVGLVKSDETVIFNNMIISTLMELNDYDLE